MTSKTTKCAYCRRRYQQAAAYEKHFQTRHLDIVLSLTAIVDAASMRPTFVHDKLENLTDLDYESDCRLEIPDFHTAIGEIDDMQNDSDTEDVSHPPVGMRPFGSRKYSRCRQTTLRSGWLYRAQQGHDR